MTWLEVVEILAPTPRLARCPICGRRPGGHAFEAAAGRWVIACSFCTRRVSHSSLADAVDAWNEKPLLDVRRKRRTG